MLFSIGCLEVVRGGGDCVVVVAVALALVPVSRSRGAGTIAAGASAEGRAVFYVVGSARVQQKDQLVDKG